jgi:LEA14-like dessication related protein
MTSCEKLLSCIQMKNIVFLFMFAGILTFISCGKPQSPDYLGFRDFSIQNLSMTETILKTNLAFYNPNPFSMELKRGNVDVYLDDQLANHYVMDSNIAIPKKDTFYVPVNLKVSPQILLNSALKMLMNNNQIKVRLLGSVRVKRSGVSFTVPFDYISMEKIQ